MGPQVRITAGLKQLVRPITRTGGERVVHAPVQRQHDVQERLLKRAERDLEVTHVDGDPSPYRSVELPERLGRIEPAEATREPEGERCPGLQVGVCLLEQLHDVIEHLLLGSLGRRCLHIVCHLDRAAAVVIPRVHKRKELQRLHGLGETAQRFLLPLIDFGVVDLVCSVEQDSRQPDVGVRLAPVVATERRAGGLQRAGQHLALETRIGHVVVVGLATQNSHHRHQIVRSEVVLPVSYDQPLRACRQTGPVRVRRQLLQIAEIRVR